MATTRGERRDPYGETARFYDLAFELPLRPLRRRALELAPPRPGLRVLDIACGTGSQLVLYARAGARCAGIDRSLAMLRQAGRKLPPTVTLLHGDGTRLPWADASFDLVLTSMSLHEMPPRVRRRLLGEARRVLAADGWALVIDYASREAVAGGRGLLVRGVVYAIEAWAGGLAPQLGLAGQASKAT